jgi:hypothetical protein
MGNVVAVFKERPFDGRVHIHPIAVCDRLPTVSQIIASAPELPAGFNEICQARINGELIPRNLWHVVRPRAHSKMDLALTFTLPLQGASSGSAGGSRKNPIAMIATIAVLLVATAVSGGTLGLPAIGFLTAGAVNALAGAGIGIAGRLEIDALGNQT